MKKLNGFTLVELMVTLIVLGILLGLAVPSFMNLYNRNKLTTSANKVTAAYSNDDITQYRLQCCYRLDKMGSGRGGKQWFSDSFSRPIAGWGKQNYDSKCRTH